MTGRAAKVDRAGRGPDLPAFPSPPAAEPVFSDDGVDLTLIRWMLSLTPAERLEVLQRHVRSVLRLRGDAPDV